MIIEIVSDPYACAIDKAHTLNFISKKTIYLGHGCNCQNTMGNGFALAIKENFPGAFEADRLFCRDVPEDHRLGKYSESFYINENKKRMGIVNLYTQFDYRPKGVNHFVPEALKNALELLHIHKGPEIILVVPGIGTGLAGGNLERDLMPVLTETPVKIVLVLQTIL